MDVHHVRVERHQAREQATRLRNPVSKTSTPPANSRRANKLEGHSILLDGLIDNGSL